VKFTGTRHHCQDKDKKEPFVNKTQQEVRIMKKMSLLLVALIITACSEAAKPPRDAAMEAATARISIASGDNVPVNPQYVTLGQVRAHCMETPQAVTAADIIADGDDLRQAAYRKYGSQVDAIVDANKYHVRNYQQIFPLFDYESYLECEGTAVHFTGEQGQPIATRSR
jgi:hypothetical protein